MEIMLPPLQSPDINFGSACGSPYATAPSSPHRFTGSFFFSAPTSPTRVSALLDTSSNYGDADQDLDDGGVDDFAFDFSGQIETQSLSAEELFDGGKIRPLKPPPRLQYSDRDPPESPKSPVRAIREVFSPRQRKNQDFDPFATAMERTRREPVRSSRGRERTKNKAGAPSATTRSLSPFRVSDLLSDPEPPKSPSNGSSSMISKSPISNALASFFNKKWKIKDLLLFRSASESRAKDEEQMKKHTILKNARLDHVKTSSFHSTSGSVSPTSSSRRRSAHEVHYAANRAVSEEMRRRTYLPYKQTLFACLGSHPSVHQFSGLSTHGSLHSRSSNSQD